MADPRLKKGLELFDQGEYFECHEVVEDLWLETDSNDRYRDLYKGVIRAAAALYQKERGIVSGAGSLAKTSIGYLEKYLPEALGVQATKFIAVMQNLLRDLEKGRRRR